jgi:hypothetical protein
LVRFCLALPGLSTVNVFAIFILKAPGTKKIPTPRMVCQSQEQMLRRCFELPFNRCAALDLRAVLTPHEGTAISGDRRDGGTEHLLHRTAGGKNLLLVPEDRQRNECNRDDPQNDVFAATFFFFLGHKEEYSIPESRFQVSS